MDATGYGPWHIFHFIGHGEFDQRRDEGRIFLADEQGKAQAISATQLNRLLAFQRGTLRLALHNACEGARGGKFDVLSSTAATLVLGGLPAVLAMQYAITDTAALEFARTFYGALADNLPVDAAVADARNAINLHDEYSLERKRLPSRNTGRITSGIRPSIRWSASVGMKRWPSLPGWRKRLVRRSVYRWKPNGKRGHVARKG